MSFRTIEVIAVAVFLLVSALAFHSWIVSHDEHQSLRSTLAIQNRVIEDANSHEQARDATLSNTLAEIAKLKKTAQSSQQLVDQLQKYLALPQPIQLINRELSSSQQISKRPLVIGGHLKRSRAGAVHALTKGKPPSSSAIPLIPPTGTRSGGDGISIDLETVPGSNSATAGSLPIQPQTGPVTISALETSGVSSDSSVLPQSHISGRASSCSDPARCAAELPASDLKPLFNYVQDCRACNAELAVAKQNASADAAKIAALTHERDAAITASKGGSFLRRLRRDFVWLSLGAALGFAASR